ncbi:hypothetical protein EV702DRAFT_1192061 [Suillus placidus]|uniref:Uncharacterized protein n=1 Tax=Suillus placidus TaxID=48579 RepID=A0A9P7D7Z5_9AGAM|nr:hypothetical protein EV702DRAFT_1192061 [Suillus placidus]
MNTYCSMPDMEAEALGMALSLLDLEEVEGSRKGKLREDAHLTDEEIAFNIQAEYLKASLAELQDRRFALSLGKAFSTDTSTTLNTLAPINYGELEPDDNYYLALILLPLLSKEMIYLPLLSHKNCLSGLEFCRFEFGSTMSSNNGITGVVGPDPDEMGDLGGSSSRLPYHVVQPSRDGMLSQWTVSYVAILSGIHRNSMLRAHIATVEVAF